MSRKNLTKNARNGFRFLSGIEEISNLKEGQKVNYAFFVNLTIDEIDQDNKIIHLLDNNNNKESVPFWMASKYLEIKLQN